MELQNLAPQALTIFSNERDILRDLFTYLDYVSERSVKRMTRTNEIPRADLQRLAKNLGGLTFEPGENEIHAEQWIYFIDNLALRMQLVSYNTKGEYRGYTSSEPSFTENYIVVGQARLQEFLAFTPAAQEIRIIDALIHAASRRDYDNYSNNEFFEHTPVSSLDRFDIWGAGTGLMHTLKFPEIRQFLLSVLQNCPAGQWLSTESLIAYLKANHPYFLIPENHPKKDRWGNDIGRYDNFHEGKREFGSERKTVPPNAPDAFERVEGRYVERFIEGIPLLMNFVDVAYDPKPDTGLLPQLGVLKAFRVNERFLRLMSGQEAAPRVTVQPNFDVVIESDFYPAGLERA